MKQIINGKLYATHSARLVDSYAYGSRNDRDYVKEELYRKKSGEFFLYGQGGPLTRYARQESYNSWSGGEQIIPESDFNVREWVERHCTADTYIKLFGPVEE